MAGGRGEAGGGAFWRAAGGGVGVKGGCGRRRVLAAGVWRSAGGGASAEGCPVVLPDAQQLAGGKCDEQSCPVAAVNEPPCSCTLAC